MSFEEVIGGGPSSKDYIKLKEVEQNSSGKLYAVVYFNDGKFFIRDFGRDSRTDEECAKNECNLNDLLGLDDWTMVYDGFPDPSITCTFITDDRVFVNLYHNPTLTHYHFIFNTTLHLIEGDIVKIVLDSNKKNFPYKTFFSEEKNEIYTFYRQG